MKLPTALEMQAIDRCAIEEFGIPGAVLMENAGLGTVRFMEQLYGPCYDTFACIFVGPGNNGGDGLVIGRHLHQRGCNPVFFFLLNPDKLTGDAAINMNIVKNLKLPFHVIDTESRVQAISVLYKQIESRGLPCYAIVDALFGTGLVRPIEGRFAAAIELINTRDFGRNVPVVSADCPSGMAADTGKVLGTCIRANSTATYGCAKPGHYMHDSNELIGRLEIIDIGIPVEVIERMNIPSDLITYDFIKRLSGQLLRLNSSHKGSHGHLLIVAGSAGKTGAAILSAKGGLRGGCGLVSLCVPVGLNTIMELNLIEAMSIPLDNTHDYFCSADLETITDAASDKQAVVLGPGLGSHPETAELVMSLYANLEAPVIVDADALNILAQNCTDFGKAAGLRIFTPHPGELSRMLGWSVEEIQNNRLEAAREAARICNSQTEENIVVLKGAGTIVAAADGTSLINTTGNPGMATGGMGDVLTGVIGAMLCQGIPPIQAAAAAVHLHGAAADSLYQEMGSGYTAGEVAEAIPTTLKSLLTEAKDENCR